MKNKIRIFFVLFCFILVVPQNIFWKPRISKHLIILGAISANKMQKLPNKQIYAMPSNEIRTGFLCKALLCKGARRRGHLRWPHFHSPASAVADALGCRRCRIPSERRRNDPRWLWNPLFLAHNFLNGKTRIKGKDMLENT